MEPTETPLDEKLCFICEKPLQGDKKNPYIKNPTLEGLKTILKVAQERGDEVHKRVSPHSDDILSFKLKVSYHKSCRASYSSSSNYTPAASEQEPARDQRPGIKVEYFAGSSGVLIFST